MNDRTDTASTRYVITHPEMGVYLGNAMGMGFWTKLDSVGQEFAVTFPGVDDARAHVSEWENNRDPDDYGYAPVTLQPGAEYVSPAELRAAGLGDLLGDMELNAPAMGNG